MTEAEFIQKMQSHQGIVNKILFLYIEDKDLRADLVQEIHLQAWKSVSNFRGDSQFSTWLYRVALNTVFAFKRKKTLPTEPIAKQDFASQHDEPSSESELLLRAIKNLNDIDKSIITLHLEGYENEEICDIIGITKNHVGVKLHRIKQALKKQLNPVSNE